MRNLPASERHTLSLTVDNEAGVLARIVGLFSARGYNIDSLTVADVSYDHAVSRITVVTSGPPPVIEQIKAQLERLVPVHSVADLTVAGPHVERELALVRVARVGANRVTALDVADSYRATVVDATADSFMFEVTGQTSKIDGFIEALAILGTIEVARTGIAAMMRGTEEPVHPTIQDEA